MSKTVTSIDEFHRTYLPDSTERERIERLTPEEWGQEVGEQAVAKGLAAALEALGE